MVRYGLLLFTAMLPQVAYSLSGFTIFKSVMDNGNWMYLATPHQVDNMCNGMKSNQVLVHVTGDTDSANFSVASICGSKQLDFYTFKDPSGIHKHSVYEHGAWPSNELGTCVDYTGDPILCTVKPGVVVRNYVMLGCDVKSLCN